MRAPKARAKILGILDYFIPQKAYDVIIFKFQGGAMAPPCRMLATPLTTSKLTKFSSKQHQSGKQQYWRDKFDNSTVTYISSSTVTTPHHYKPYRWLRYVLTALTATIMSAFVRMLRANTPVINDTTTTLHVDERLSDYTLSLYDWNLKM